MYHSQYKQDEFLDEHVFKKMTGGVFLEIGADDGIAGSNTLFFEEDRNWSGICIEPRSSAFEKLRKNRRCICENVCISDTTGTKSFLEISGKGDQLSGLAESYDPQHLERIHKENVESVLTTKVCTTIEDLLDTHGIQSVDYLSLDVEGGELKILQSINFESMTIGCISVENNYNDKKIQRFLSSKNYRRLVRLKIDEIYVKKDGPYDTYREPFRTRLQNTVAQTKRFIKTHFYDSN